MDLTAQTAVVTGASSGIGLGIATVLAERGANVAMWSRTEERLKEAAAGVQHRAAGRVIFRAVDVRDRAQVDSAAAEVATELGAITLLVNGAGTAGPAGPDWKVDPDAWWECVETSVKGSLLCERAVLSAMISAGTGRIVEIVSVTGTNAFPLIGATSVAKTALIRHAENVAAAVAGAGVKVFALHPGTVKTKLLDSYRSNPQMAAFLGSLSPDMYTEPRTVGERVARIAHGDLDALSGCFVDATADVDEVVAEMGDGSPDAHRLRLVRRLRGD